jgi:putative flippase GtrA
VSLAELIFFALLIYSLDVSYLIASTIIFFFGLVASFILRKIWVFSHKSIHPGNKQLLIYSTIFSISLGVNLLIMYLMVDILKANELLSQLVSMFLIGFFNYSANKTITFKKLPTTELTLSNYISETRNK